MQTLSLEIGTVLVVLGAVVIIGFWACVVYLDKQPTKIEKLINE